MANGAGQGIILVASHAVQVVVVDHSHQGHTTFDKCFQDRQVRHLVDVNNVGIEVLNCTPGCCRIVPASQWREELEGFQPCHITLSGRSPVQYADSVSPATQGAGGLKNVGFRAAMKPELIVDKKYSHIGSRSPAW